MLIHSSPVVINQRPDLHVAPHLIAMHKHLFNVCYIIRCDYIFGAKGGLSGNSIDYQPVTLKAISQ